MSFSVVAVPLNRPEIVAFLVPAREVARGAPVQIVSQRPTLAAEAQWLRRLGRTENVGVDDLLALDDPHSHLAPTHTDRLVPVQFLQEPGFLTRNLGGWTPIYFGVLNARHAGGSSREDPFLAQMETLRAYGGRIPYFGANLGQVAARLEEETGVDMARTAESFVRIGALRQREGSNFAFAERLYKLIAGGDKTGETAAEAPRLLLLDALLNELVHIELARREAVADGDQAKADEITSWQAQKAAAHGLRLILKGEYIVGRHRRSTVMIAPELGAVVKQPAPEPFHEVVLNAHTYDGHPENWPRLTRDGSLVTARGRLRLTLEEGLIPRLNQVFDHGVLFSTLLGLIIEPYVDGPTAQEIVLADAGRLTPSLYDEFVLHQQVCEVMGIENGDWHAANFIAASNQSGLVHIDWGAARPLHPDELTPEGERGRLDQVQNIAYSFHDEALAERTLALHAALIGDALRLARLRHKAVEIASRG